MDRSLSGLNGDPCLAARVIAAQKEHPPMKKKAPLGLIIAAVLLMMSMTAAIAAGQLGLFDLLRDRHVYLAPEARSLIVEPAEQHTLDWEHVSLHVSEVLCADGEAAVLVDIEPVSDEYLILPEDWLIANGLPESGRQIIALRFLSPSLQASGSQQAGAWWGCTPPTLRQTGNGLQALYNLSLGSFVANTENLSIRLRFESYPVTSPDDLQTQDKRTYAPASISFPLTVTSPQPETIRHASGMPIELPGAGIRIDDVTLLTTSLRSAARLTITITDQELFGQITQLFFEPRDEAGSPIGFGFGSNKYVHNTIDQDTFAETCIFAPYTGDTLSFEVHALQHGQIDMLTELTVLLE